jgi:ABC-type Zn uptake system ZnuABC Zn-binding protein ZnuA
MTAMSRSFIVLPLLALAASPLVSVVSSASAASPRSSNSSKAFSCPAAAINAGKTTKLLGTRLRIATTVAPITSIVANVVGSAADVEGIVPEGTNSHTFEPKPSVAKLMTKADVVFVNGLKLEEPTKDLATENMAKSAQLIELGTLTLPPSQYIFDFSFPKEGGKPNPHLWTNPPMAKCYAQIVLSVVSKADPGNVSTYKANAAMYLAKLDQLDSAVKTATATVPAAARKLLTYHDAYAYFSQQYGWTVIGAVQPSSFDEPTPKEVARLITQVKKEKVKAIFGSEVFPSPVLAQIAKEAGANYVDKLRDDDLPGKPGDKDHSFLGLMQFDFVTMVSALGGNAAAVKAFDPTDVTPDKASYPQ